MLDEGKNNSMKWSSCSIKTCYKSGKITFEQQINSMRGTRFCQVVSFLNIDLHLLAMDHHENTVDKINRLISFSLYYCRVVS